MGIIAVAPPNSTAKRSSEIAPSTVRRRKTKRRPWSRLASRNGSGATFARTGFMVIINETTVTSRTTTVPYATSGPQSSSTPLNAGPMITPVWKSVEFTATALGNTSRGTRFGVIA